MPSTNEPGEFKQRPSVMSEEEFVHAFGTLYEHSAWVARRTWNIGLKTEHDTLDGLANALADTLAKANETEKLALICAHPDLAGKAAIKGELTTESTDEQASAGIDQCSEAEFERFQQLNNSYKEKFKFPFIKAVRGSNKDAILAAFEDRINNDRQTEFECALQEINKIARFRLQAIIETEQET